MLYVAPHTGKLRQNLEKKNEVCKVTSDMTVRSLGHWHKEELTTGYFSESGIGLASHH